VRFFPWYLESVERDSSSVGDGSSRSRVLRNHCRQREKIHLQLYFYTLWHSVGARGSVSMLQAGRPRVRFPIKALDFSIDLILPTAANYGPGVDSACNRNEYQEIS
jgi:hypothetical protein